MKGSYGDEELYGKDFSYSEPSTEDGFTPTSFLG
jgi:hypothetical protein